MSTFKKTELQLDHKYDPTKKQHFLNGTLTVLHCHHYSTLYTQLAIDSQETNLLTQVAEEVFYDELKKYFEKHQVNNLAERISLASEYYAAVGLGKLVVKSLGDDAGEVEVRHSHIDAGWMKKWGKTDRPVNFIGAGFIAAIFAAVTNNLIGAFTANEIQSIAMGAPQSIFRVVKN